MSSEYRVYLLSSSDGVLQSDTLCVLDVRVPVLPHDHLLGRVDDCSTRKEVDWLSERVTQ